MKIFKFSIFLLGNGLQSNLSLCTLLYYGQFGWSQKCQKSYIPYPYNTDKSVNRTIGSVPLVSVLKRFDCSRPLWNVNSEGGGGGVYSERPSVVGGGGNGYFLK